MKADTLDWIRKAEGDFATACREIDPPEIYFQTSKSLYAFA
jgi:hypothetical protein